jgi:hypothetical protein
MLCFDDILILGAFVTATQQKNYGFSRLTEIYSITLSIVLSEISEFDLENEEFIKELADRYKVSTQAMTFRLAYLGYIQL